MRPFLGGAGGDDCQAGLPVDNGAAFHPGVPVDDCSPDKGAGPNHGALQKHGVFHVSAPFDPSAVGHDHPPAVPLQVTALRCQAQGYIVPDAPSKGGTAVEIPRNAELESGW